MVKKRFQIRGMHCTGCAMVVDGAVEDLSGVKSAATSYARQVVEVDYDEGKVTHVQIIEAIQSAGYQAELITGKSR